VTILSFVHGTDGYYTLSLDVDGTPAVLRISGGGYMSRIR
jgi:hypothetical protein